jgi:hypothetical protein
VHGEFGGPVDVAQFLSEHSFVCMGSAGLGTNA